MSDEGEDRGALVFTCPACGKDFTALGEACPHCGASLEDLPPIIYTPPRSGAFKIIVWLILISFITLIFAAAVIAFLPS